MNTSPNSPFNLPPLSDLQQMITSTQDKKAASELVARQNIWQQRVDSLEAELSLLKTRAETGNYTVNLSSNETPASQNDHETLRREYDDSIKQMVVINLGTLGLQDGESCLLDWEVSHEYSIGMGDGYVHRNRRELLAKFTGAWFYVSDEQSIHHEDIPSKGRVPAPGFTKYILSPFLSSPLVETGNQLKALEPSLHDLRTLRWENVHWEIKSAVERMRCKKVIDKCAELLSEAAPQPPEIPRFKFRKDLTRALDGQGGSLEIIGRYIEPASDPMLLGSDTPDPQLYNVSIVHKNTKGEKESFSVSSRDYTAQNYGSTKKAHVIDQIEELLGFFNSSDAHEVDS